MPRWEPPRRDVGLTREELGRFLGLSPQVFGRDLVSGMFHRVAKQMRCCRIDQIHRMKAEDLVQVHQPRHVQLGDRVVRS